MHGYVTHMGYNASGYLQFYCTCIIEAGVERALNLPQYFVLSTEFRQSVLCRYCLFYGEGCIIENFFWFFSRPKSSEDSVRHIRYSYEIFLQLLSLGFTAAHYNSDWYWLIISATRWKVSGREPKGNSRKWKKNDCRVTCAALVVL